MVRAKPEAWRSSWTGTGAGRRLAASRSARDIAKERVPCGARSRRPSTSASSRSPCTPSRRRTGRGRPTRSSRSWSSWTRRSTASFRISRSRACGRASSGVAIAIPDELQEKMARLEAETAHLEHASALDRVRLRRPRRACGSRAQRFSRKGPDPRTCPRRPSRHASTLPSSPIPTS